MPDPHPQEAPAPGATSHDRFSLADVVDRLGLEGPRDRTLVLRTAAWLHDHADVLVLETAASAGLQDVVATLQMKDRVEFVVTGTRDGEPGEWTWKVAERDFPKVMLQKRPEVVEAPCLFCTVDYAAAGAAVLLPTGDPGTLVVASTVGADAQVRVRLADGSMATFPARDVVMPDV